jgi:predicted nucleotidyltransferase
MSELAPHSQAGPLQAENVIAILRAHVAKLRAAGIKRLSLFGSTARGDADPESDVELAVVLDPAAHIGLIGLSALERRIGDLIGCKVELVPEPVETPHLRASIDRDRKLAF